MQLAKGFPVAIMNFSFQGQKKGGIAICGNSLTCSGIFLLILTIAKAKKTNKKNRKLTTILILIFGGMQRRGIWLVNLFHLLSFSVLLQTGISSTYLIYKRSSSYSKCWKRALCPPFPLPLIWTVAGMICLQRINSFHWDAPVFVKETISCLPEHLFDYHVIVFLNKGCVMLCDTSRFSSLVSFVFLHKIM